MARNLIVRGTHTLIEGTQLTASDIQITAVMPSGEFKMVDLEIVPDKTTSNSQAIELRSGSWLLQAHTMLPLELPDTAYYLTDTYRELSNHLRLFTNKLDVFTKLGIPPRRSILLSSDPGVGKTSLINYFCKGLLDTYGDTISINRIATNDIHWDSLERSYQNADIPLKLVVMVLEDIGGVNLDERGSSVSSDLLNFLDGNNTFAKYPTLIIGTTNFINQLAETLTDRPGRFDLVLHVQPPADSELKFLSESLLDRELTVEECNAMLGQKFTPAYCREIVIRHLLYDMSIADAVKQLLGQRNQARGKTHGTSRRELGL